MYSAQYGSEPCTLLLLEARAHVNARDEDGLRPLHFGAASASFEVCEILLSHGAEWDVLDDDGRRPIDHVPQGFVVTKAERLRWEARLDPSALQPTQARVASREASRQKAEAEDGPTPVAVLAFRELSRQRTEPEKPSEVQASVAQNGVDDGPTQVAGMANRESSRQRVEPEASVALNCVDNGPPQIAALAFA